MHTQDTKYNFDKSVTINHDGKEFTIEYDSSRTNPAIFNFLDTDPEITDIKDAEKKLRLSFADNIFKISPELLINHPELAIPEIKYNSHAEAKKAVTENGYNLFHVATTDLRNNPEICIEAAKKDDFSVASLPEDILMLHPEICTEAVKKLAWDFAFIPEAFQMQHPELCIEAVKKKDSLLKFVPEAVKMQHPAIALAAVQQNGRALKRVPEAVKMQHPVICIEAVKQDEAALEFVPEALKTNLKVLAKLFTTTEEQLIADLALLKIDTETSEQVLPYMQAQMATSSDRLLKLLSPDLNPNYYLDCGLTAVLLTMKEYIHPSTTQVDDEKESRSFTP